MSAGEGRDAELAALLAERAESRAALVRAIGRAEAHARDPLGLKAAVRRHPMATAGIATAVGALLVRAFLPGRGGRDAKPAEDRRPEHRDGPGLLDGLRDMAVRAAMPYVARLAEQFLGGAAGEPADARNGRDETGTPSAAAGAAGSGD